MEPSVYLAFLALLPILLFLTKFKNRSSKKLPPGSLGFPIIGQTFEISKAIKANKLEVWLQERIKKYGPISKFHYIGSPTVFLHGLALNKYVFTADEKMLSTKQPPAIRMLVGDRVLHELTGDDHKRMRDAMSTFLNPEALKQYVGQMEEEIRMHLDQHWHHNKEILVMPLMKTLTFNMISTLIFGIERGRRRDELKQLFARLAEGYLEIPLNLPFTRFNRSLNASSKARGIIMDLINEKKEKVQKQDIPDRPDLITSLLRMRDGTGSDFLLHHQEIVDNCIGLMLAGHDTTSILLSCIIKILAENPHVYETVLREQEEIAKGKASGELLTWDDLNKMKYTWKVATETLRIYQPATLSFRTVLEDIEIGGFTIPKGWKVLWTGSTTHLDSSIYPDPYKFDPSRYEKQGATPPYSFIAFGGGRRMCPGNEFARIETLIFIHHLVTRFQWKLSLKENTYSRDPMPVFIEGLPMQIKIKKPNDHA